MRWFKYNEGNGLGAREWGRKGERGEETEAVIVHGRHGNVFLTIRRERRYLPAKETPILLSRSRCVTGVKGE